MAVLLSRDAARGALIAARVFGLWYGVLLIVSLTLTPADLESGTAGGWIAWGLHLSPDHVCVMCGLTRSFAAMSHGQWLLAADYNAAGPLLYLAMLVLAAWAVTSSVRALAGRARLNALRGQAGTAR